MAESYLERITAQLIKDAKLPAPIREYRLRGECGKRRWRADFLFLDKRVILEVMGGVYVNGAHVRGKGYESDCEKLNWATLEGFQVLRVTKKHLMNGEMIKWLKKALL